MESMKEFFKNDRFATANGMSLSEVKPGFAIAEMEITERHLNAANVIQGGALFTLADLAFAAAVNAHGQIALAINAEISFFKGVDSGKIFAEAKEVSFHPKLATYSVEIRNEDEELLASFRGTAYRKRDAIPMD